MPNACKSDENRTSAEQVILLPCLIFIMLPLASKVQTSQRLRPLSRILNAAPTHSTGRDFCEEDKMTYAFSLYSSCPNERRRNNSTIVLRRRSNIGNRIGLLPNPAFVGFSVFRAC
jgi:hypothetical protein